jgi:hypothetical protein
MRNGHPYSYLDIERDPDVQALLDGFHIAASDVPVVICRGQLVLKFGAQDACRSGHAPRLRPQALRRRRGERSAHSGTHAISFVHRVLQE